MTASAERQHLELAADIFEGLGAAVNHLQVYGAEHPRCREAQGSLRRLLRQFGEEQPRIPRLSFRLTDGTVEFQRVPLPNMTAHGERLSAALRSLAVGIIEIAPAIEADEVRALVQLLNERAMRCRKFVPGDSSRDLSPHFRILTEEEAAQIVFVPTDREAGKTIDADLALPDLNVSERALSSVIAAFHSLLLNIENELSFDYTSLRKASQGIVRLFDDRRNPFWSMISRGYFDDFTFHHSLNVALIASKVASAVTKDADLIGRVTMAGILHDIGKSRIPREILMKPGKLTPGEQERMREHPSLGAEVLLSTPDVDPACVTAAFRHHAHSAAGGYPKTLSEVQNDWVTDVISVVDVYEALTAVRPYKKAISPEKAFHIMATMPAMSGRLPIVKLLYDLIGPHPVGAVVILNTGERAVVTEQNSADLYRPKVRILTDSNRIAYPIPRDVDLLAVPGKGQENGLFIRQTVIPQSPDDDPLAQDVPTEQGSFLRDRALEDNWFGGREG